MNMNAVLAIDQGTTSTKAITFSDTGEVLAVSRSPLKQIYPQHGWVEQDPDDLLESVISSMRDAYQQATAKNIKISSIGITNQRETTIVWDKTNGRPIYNAIVWQDRRTAEFIDTLKSANVESVIRSKTGLMLDPYFSASKISWILDNIPIARPLAEQNKLLFGTVDAFLIWKLTDGLVHATDVTNASRTSLFNIRTLEWDTELLNIYNIPSNILPETKKCTDNFGNVSKVILGESIPIYGVAGDQQAALIGQHCFTEGQVKSTYGTGCFALANTGDKIIESENNLISTISYQLSDTLAYGIEGSIFMAGGSSDWLINNLGIIRDHSEIESICNSVSNDHDVYMVPAFTGLGAPWWEPNTRAAIYGLGRETSKNELVRATIESVAYQTNDLIMSMVKDGVSLAEMRVDGGMVTNHWFLQFLSDITRLNIQKSSTMECTALGAAILSGIGHSTMPSTENIACSWENSFSTKPSMSMSQRNKLINKWTQAVTATISYHSS